MIFISLTTVPKRLEIWPAIQRNLESLLRQKTNKEYYVIFNIPQTYTMDDNVEYIIPDELWGFSKSYPKLIINRSTPDYGPIVKIYGALQYVTNPSDILIVVDDDNIYHEDMIECHLQKLNQYPNYVICYASDAALKKVETIENDVKGYKFDSHTIQYPIKKDEYVRSPGHNGSVSYKRSYFKEDFIPELFNLADGDDPLMGYYLKKHAIHIICAKYDEKYITQCAAFPIVRGIGFPQKTAGDLIRKKYPQTIHGRQSEELQIYLSNNNIFYIEEKR
jgi:hypothetical protein